MLTNAFYELIVGVNLFFSACLKYLPNLSINEFLGSKPTKSSSFMNAGQPGSLTCSGAHLAKGCVQVMVRTSPAGGGSWSAHGMDTEDNFK